MGGIDILVEGSPESLRETATKLNQLARLLHDNGGKVHRAASESEACWSGEAADKGRTFVQGTGKVIDEVVDTAHKIARAHDDLAAALDGVISRVYQARGVAQQAKLAVTDTEILPPKPLPSYVLTGTPALAPAGPASQGPSAPAQQAALADHQKKQAAFDEASKSIEQARHDERDAHNRFRDDIHKHTSILETLKSGAVLSGLGVVRTMASAPNANAKQFAEEAASKSKDAKAAKNLYSNPNMSAARRAIAEEKYSTSSLAMRKAARNSFSSSMVDRFVPGADGVKQMIAKAPGENIAKNGSNALIRGAGKVAKAFPVSNILLAGAGTALSMSEGTPWDKSVASNVGGTVASTGAYVGAEAGLVALGVAGGPATLVGIGAGIAVSAGVSWFVDNHWDDVKHTASNAWDSIS